MDAEKLELVIKLIELEFKLYEQYDYISTIESIEISEIISKYCK